VTSSIIELTLGQLKMQVTAVDKSQKKMKNVLLYQSVQNVKRNNVLNVKPKYMACNLCPRASKKSS
jgi:hypothetical protein